MIGLAFLAAGLLWLALAVYLSARLPQWLGLQKLLWPARATLLALLLVGPFIDHIVGMRQFEKLCAERTAPRIADGAQGIELARVSDFNFQQVSGLFINVQVSTVTYSDATNGRKFLEYEYFKTKGGRIAGFAMMGGWHSCSAEKSDRYSALLNNIPAYQNFLKGVQK